MSLQKFFLKKLFFKVVLQLWFKLKSNLFNHQTCIFHNKEIFEKGGWGDEKYF